MPPQRQFLKLPNPPPQQVWQMPMLTESVTIHRYNNPAERVLEMVANAYGVEMVSLLGPRRNKQFIQPRHLVWYLCRHVLRMSYPAISKRFNRDHSSVHHGCRAIDALRAKDLQFEFYEAKMIDDLSQDQ
jgi:chromosomal replication initiation ATPase DnaA